MATFVEFHVKSLAFTRQAERYEDMALGLNRFPSTWPITQQGPFIGPLVDSIGRGSSALVSAAALLRSASSECSRRAQLVLDHSIAVRQWEQTYLDLPPDLRPRRPFWTQSWSNL